MNKAHFYITGAGGRLTDVNGYIYDSGRDLYGIDKRGRVWYITHIMTGFAISSETYATRAAALEAITEETENKISEMMKTGKFAPALKLIAEAYEKDGRLTRPETAPTKEKTRRAIKNRTYNNFMRVYNAIRGKGYDRETAETITRRIFDQYEANPNGLSVWGLVDLIKGEESPAEAPQTDETTTTEETPTATGNEAQRGTEAQSQTAADKAPEKAPRTGEKPEAIQNNTRGNKSPSRGAEKPHRGKGRGRHSPRPKPPRPERVFGFQGERVFVTYKMPLLYKGIPPGG